MKRRELTIPTLLGILVSVIGLGAGVWFLRNPIKSAVFASVEETPSQIRVTNITDTSFAISWLTQKSTSGYLQYSQNSNLDLVVSDDRDQEGGTVANYFTHFITVRGLKPATTYNFRLGSGARQYDQDGKPYQVTTGQILGSPPQADVAYGQALTPNGEPADGSIVYLSLPGVVPQAALVKSSGSWVIPISTSRSSDLTSFAAYDPINAQVQLEVTSGSMGQSSVTTTTAQVHPVPDITLGQTYNYLASTTASPIPTDAAASASGSSRFSAATLQPATESPVVLTLLSPKMNEQLNSDQPQIIGRGPANSDITITIHSDEAITATAKTNALGEFSYTVPSDLSPGVHTITISTLVNGVLKQVQRSFTVLAAEDSQVPAFTATPSATLTPSPSPSPSPTPTLSPSPTPAVSPRVSLPSTESGVPTSGNLTPTLVLLILGAGLILSGLVVYRKII